MEKRTVRVFFALWPSRDARRTLSAWQAPLLHLCGGRAMRPDTLHTTLVFIGEIAESRLETLKQAALAVTSPAFMLSFEQVGYWCHNRIAHAVPNTIPPALTELVGQLTRHLSQHQFTFDARPYQPHVTLLRNARWPEAPLPALPTVSWSVHSFTLVQSLSDMQGARYRVLAEFDLE